jgi:hypothetical protein
MVTVTHFIPDEHKKPDERTARALEFIARMFGEMHATQQEIADDIAEIKKHVTKLK